MSDHLAVLRALLPTVGESASHYTGINEPPSAGVEGVRVTKQQLLAPGDLLTMAEMLEIVPVGRSTLYNLVAENQIPAIRVRRAGSRRGRILIHRADLEAFIEELRAEGVA